MTHQPTLAVYGGGFDPPHIGHDRCLQILLNHVDEVLVVPCGTPTHKAPSETPVEVRLQRCEAWVAEYGSRVTVLDWEALDTLSGYTCDLVARVHDEYPDYHRFLAIGADQLRDFPTWKGNTDIFPHADLLTIERGGIDIEQHQLDWVHSAGGSIELIKGEGEPIDCSSSAIRAAIAAGEDSWKQWLKPPVVDVIAV